MYDTHRAEKYQKKVVSPKCPICIGMYLINVG